jgi:hypothetical protein
MIVKFERSAQGERIEPTKIRKKLRVILSEIVHVDSVYIRGYYCLCGPDGPGIESRRRRDFPHLSKPALSPAQPPVKWVPCLSRR